MSDGGTGKKCGAPSHDLFIHRFDVVVAVETKRPGPPEKAGYLVNQIIAVDLFLPS